MHRHMALRALCNNQPNRGAVAQNHNLSNRGRTNALSGHARQNGPERIERVGNIQRSAATLLHPRPIGAQLRTHKHAQQDSRKNQAVIQVTVAYQKRLRQTAARQTPQASALRGEIPLQQSRQEQPLPVAIDRAQSGH